MKYVFFLLLTSLSAWSKPHFSSFSYEPLPDKTVSGDFFYERDDLKLKLEQVLFSCNFIRPQKDDLYELDCKSNQRHHLVFVINTLLSKGAVLNHRTSPKRFIDLSFHE